MNDHANDGRTAHWDKTYAAKSVEEVSWFQERPDLSLALTERTGLPIGAAILDVGGGASSLVDHLLAAGHRSLTVLDISQRALTQAQGRLGAAAAFVTWIAADITAWRTPAKIDLWHDRAVLHFLTRPADQQAYADALRAALKPGGWAIIAGFAPGGPTKCSGLPIVQHDANSLTALLGPGFELIDTRDELHRTPWGAAQAFRYHLFHRGAEE